MMDLLKFKAAIVMEGDLSGAYALELIAEVERLTAEGSELAEFNIKTRIELYAKVERLTEDAERWRAIIGCARVRVLGSAGVVEPKPEGYAHIGVELWTHYPSGSEPMAVEHMTKFADLARKAVRP